MPPLRTLIPTESDTLPCRGQEQHLWFITPAPAGTGVQMSPVFELPTMPRSIQLPIRNP
jgi:hypothetical protein